MEKVKAQAQLGGTWHPSWSVDGYANGAIHMHGQQRWMQPLAKVYDVRGKEFPASLSYYGRIRRTHTPRWTDHIDLTRDITTRQYCSSVVKYERTCIFMHAARAAHTSIPHWLAALLTIPKKTSVAKSQRKRVFSVVPTIDISPVMVCIAKRKCCVVADWIPGHSLRIHVPL